MQESPDEPAITSQVDAAAAQVDIPEATEYQPDIVKLENEFDEFQQSKNVFDQQVDVDTWQNPSEKVLAIDVSNNAGVVLNHFAKLCTRLHISLEPVNKLLKLHHFLLVALSETDDKAFIKIKQIEKILDKGIKAEIRSLMDHIALHGHGDEELPEEKAEKAIPFEDPMDAFLFKEAEERAKYEPPITSTPPRSKPKSRITEEAPSGKKAEWADVFEIWFIAVYNNPKMEGKRISLSGMVSQFEKILEKRNIAYEGVRGLSADINNKLYVWLGLGSGKGYQGVPLNIGYEDEKDPNNPRKKKKF